MIHIFTAKTGWKEFRKHPLGTIVSLGIKFFTYPWAEGLKLQEVPTHLMVGEDRTLGNVRLIFESNKTGDIRPYYGPTRTFGYWKYGTQIIDYSIFWTIAKHTGELYGLFQWINFFRMWFWKVLFNKDVIGKNAWITWLNVCSEHGWTDLHLYSEKFDFPVIKGELAKVNPNHAAPIHILNIINRAITAGEMKELNDYGSIP